MCLVFKTQTYRDIGGFDERFHMYCEDVDICLKIHLKGGYVSWIQSAVIVHDAQRTSRRNWRYLIWHVTSLLRLFGSPAYWRFRVLGLRGSKGAQYV
jgi:GT2 family glycosyltransferase